MGMFEMINGIDNSIMYSEVYSILKAMNENDVKYDWLYGEVGSVIGTHVGPGAAAVAYFVK